MDLKSAIPVILVVAPLAAGYLVRRRGWLSERFARGLMTGILVLGYPAAGFFSIWQMRLRAGDFWLPALGSVHLVLMAGGGLLIGRLVGRDRQETGLLAIGSTLGNAGFTMGGLVLYHLYGTEGLGLMSIYCLMWMPMIVLVTYPIARHYSPGQPGRSLAGLIARSLFDWRSLGLPIGLAAVALSLGGVAAPPAVRRLYVVDTLVVLVTVAAYFSIGLRLHVGQFAAVKRLIAAVSAARFGLGLALGGALAGATLLTPWPLRGNAMNAFLIESFVPTAVTMVGVANMFDIRPREASLVFVVNTLLYLAVVLPVVLLAFGG